MPAESRGEIPGAMEGQDMSGVESLIAELASEGRVDSEGAFSLDRDKAREKMRQFQLADPVRYVLELVQAAVVKGATRIRFDIDADDMRMRFDGVPFTADDFEHVYGSLLSSAESPETEARRELALGLNAAMALNPSFIKVESGGAQGGAFLEMRPGRDDLYGPRETGPGETLIHVRQRFRPGLVVQFFRNIAGTLAEEHLIRNDCCFAPIEVDLEGRRVSGGYRLEAVMASSEIDTPEARGVIGLSHGEILKLGTGAPARSAELHLLKHGVWIITHETAELLPGTEAVIEARQLRKDVSQADFVRDDAFDRLIDVLRQNELDLLFKLCRESPTKPSRAPEMALSRLLSWHIARAGTPATLARLDGLPPDHPGRQLLELPLWTTISGRPVTLNDLLAERREGRFVAYSLVRSELLPDEERSPILHLATEEEEESLRRIFPSELEDRTEQVRRAEWREANRRAWLSRPTNATLRDIPFLARRSFQTEHARGEVGLRRQESEDVAIAFIKDGRLLTEHQRPFAILGLQVVIEADFTPNELFDDVMPDLICARALATALEALVPLFDDVARLRSSKSWRQTCLLSFLEALSHSQAMRRALAELGIPLEQSAEVDAQVTSAWSLYRLVGRRERWDNGPPRLHAINQVPLLPTWGTSPVSIDRLRREIEAHGDLRTLRQDQKQLPEAVSLPDRLWQRAEELAYEQAGVALDRSDPRRPIFCPKAVTSQILGEVGHDWKPVHYDEACEYLLGACRLLERTEVSPNKLPTTIGKVGLEHRLVEGVLGRLRYSDGYGKVSLLWQLRKLDTIPVPIPVRGLAAIAAHNGLLPRPDLKGVEDDAAVGEVREALARTIPELVKEMLQVHDSDPQDQRARMFLGDVAAALFPTVAFRRAYDAFLRVYSSRKEAESEYLTLLRIAAVASPARVHKAIVTKVMEDRKLSTKSVAKEVFDQNPEDALARLEASQGTLAWLKSIYASDGRLSERVLDPMPRLCQARLFESVDGEDATLGQVIDAFRSYHEIRYVRERPPGEIPTDRLRLLASDQETRDLLERLFGFSALIEDRDWLEDLQRRYYASTRPLSELRLWPDEVLCSVPIEHEALEGEIGLAREHKGMGFTKLVERQCKQRREVGSREFPFQLALVVVVNDDRIEMTGKWDRILEDPGTKDRVDVYASHLPRLARALCRRWPDITSETARETARMHALDLLALQGKHSMKEAESLGVEALQELSELPLFLDSLGQRRSVAELNKWSEANKERIRYVTDESIRGEPLDPQQIVLVVSPYEQQRLRQINEFPCRNYNKSWERERKIITWRESAPAIPAVGELPAIHRSGIGLPPGFEGELIIPAEPLTQGDFDHLPRVRFGIHGHLVESLPVSDILPCGGVITGEKLGVTADCSAVDLKKHQRHRLDRMALTLYEGLCRRFELDELTNWDERNVARTYLGAAAILMIRQGELPSRRYTKLLSTLEKLPLLDLPNGRAISIEVARKERPPELNRLGLWPSRGARSEERGVASTGGPHPAVPPVPEGEGGTPAGRTGGLATAEPPKTDSPSPPPTPEEREDRGAKASAKEPAKTDSPSPLPTPEDREDRGARAAKELRKTDSPSPPPTPEELLLEGVLKELHLVRDRNERLLSEVNLELLHIGDAPRKLAVACDERQTVINRRHPMVKIALDRCGTDPLWVTFLASAVYTGINCWLEEVTDEDEARFHHLLTQLVVSGLSGTR